MNGQNPKINISLSSTAAVTTTTASSNAILPRQRMVQNFLLIWMDASIEETTKDCQNTLAELRSIVNDINIFTKSDECIQFLNTIDVEKVLIIASGYLGQHLVPNIHDMPQLDTIYIICGNKSRHEQWTKKWTKIKGVYTDIVPICQALQRAVKQCNQDAIPMSFVTVSEATSSENLNQLESSFMYTQIFKEILLELKYDQQSINDLADYCRKLYPDNTNELNIINEFECDYRAQFSIWWYTRECFTYQMLNRALRTLEADTIINMGFFLRDLHQTIEQLHHQQVTNYHGESFLVYRGQGLSKTNFEKLLKTRGGLISFNNLLSTSKNRKVSLGFAESALTKTDMVGILFQMSINPSVKSTPFASIQEVSYHKDEEEILFFMHTVFRIHDISKIDNNRPLHQVELTLTSDDDQQLRTLTNRIREEAGGKTGWERLGNLLVKIGQFNKAEELYNVLLEQTSDDSQKAIYYNNLGCVKTDQSDYEKAIWCSEKALEISQKTFPVNHPLLAASNNNIASAYHNMGEYSKALSFYEKSLELYEKTVPGNHPLLATTYNNIGEVYRNIGENSKALSFYAKSLELYEKTLPPNHPDFAQSYSNIGLTYYSMGEYSKALSFYEKSLEIRQKTLPENHSSLATSYNNIAGVYHNMGEYWESLSFYEKALEIYEKTLSPNHPLLATSYNNIGLVYQNIGEKSKALSCFEKALEIYQKTLPSNHSLLAVSYNNIGLVYQNTEENSKALSCFEKAVEIYQKTLPENHPSLATAYNNIGLVYRNMFEYSKALSFYEKSLEMYQKTLPPNHLDLAISYNNIGDVNRNLGDYSKARSFYDRALDIFQRSLPANHPYIQTVQRNIELLEQNS